MKYEMQGKIAVLFDTKHISDKFSKREFVLDVEDGRYSQTVLFESSGKMLEELDMYQSGDEVNVHFNVRGREWRSPSGETKYFNSLSAWKIERVGAAPTRSAPSAGRGSSQTTTPATPATPAAPPPGVDDDIPF